MPTLTQDETRYNNLLQRLKLMESMDTVTYTHENSGPGPRDHTHFKFSRGLKQNVHVHVSQNDNTLYFTARTPEDVVTAMDALLPDLREENK